MARSTLVALLLGLTTLTSMGAADQAPIAEAPVVPRSDGVSPSVDPSTGATMVLAPGMPLLIKKGIVGVDVVDVSGQTPDRGPLGTRTRSEPRGNGTESEQTCVQYHAAYIQNPSFSYNENTGGAVRIEVQNLPLDNMGSLCHLNGTASFWVLLVFADGDYIQAGVSVYRPSPGAAKAFCESRDTAQPAAQKYDATPNFANGAFLAFTVVKDSNGVWRTYYADLNGGAVSIEIGCTLTGHSATEGDGNQFSAEVTPTTSTNVEIGPMRLTELRAKVLTQWRYTTSLTASYQATPAGSAVCPPYGAGPITGYDVRPGTGRPCTTGTFTYPA